MYMAIQEVIILFPVTVVVPRLFSNGHINEFFVVASCTPVKSRRAESSILCYPSDADTTAVSTLDYFSIKSHTINITFIGYRLCVVCGDLAVSGPDLLPNDMLKEELKTRLFIWKHRSAESTCHTK